MMVHCFILLIITSLISYQTFTLGTPVPINQYEMMHTAQMYSSAVERGRRLVGNVQRRRGVPSLASCYSECRKMVPLCVSLNFAVWTTPGTSSYLCELNDVSLDDDSKAYIEDPGFVYYDIFSEA